MASFLKCATSRLHETLVIPHVKHITPNHSLRVLFSKFWRDFGDPRNLRIRRAFSRNSVSLARIIVLERLMVSNFLLGESPFWLSVGPIFIAFAQFARIARKLWFASSIRVRFACGSIAQTAYSRIAMRFAIRKMAPKRDSQKTLCAPSLFSVGLASI